MTAHQIGEAGDGLTILTMVHHTRLDSAMAPVGPMRAALLEALHWVEHRRAFQRRLLDQPLMRAVLADLALDWEGALALGMRVAAAFDDRAQGAFARVGVALAKYLNNKLCPRVTLEAMEVLGGIGYVEEAPLAMLYREAPLNGIWEGSGNVICLDIPRTLARVPEAGESLAAELQAARGVSTDYDAALAAFRARWQGLPAEAEARLFAERAALLLAASVLLRQAPHAVAERFVQTRLGGEAGRIAGALPAGDTDAILDRITPDGVVAALFRRHRDVPKRWSSRPQAERTATMDKDRMIGVDLAKRVFQLHGATMRGNLKFRKKLTEPPRVYRRDFCLKLTRLFQERSYSHSKASSASCGVT